MTEDTAIEPIELGQVHEFNLDLKPVAWSKIREEIAPQGIKLDTTELVNQKFILQRIKKFPSSYGGQDYAYFVVGQTTEDKHLFNTVLGGGQPMEVLDAIYKHKLEQPIEFILTWNEGGAYGGYYTLE